MTAPPLLASVLLYTNKSALSLLLAHGCCGDHSRLARWRVEGLFSPMTPKALIRAAAARSDRGKLGYNLAQQ
jgi:hypothetical protein